MSYDQEPVEEQVVPEPPMETPAEGGLPTQEARTWAMVCHILGLAGLLGIPFGNILGPLVVWLLKKEQFAFVNEQGKEALNFQITMLIYGIVAGILCFVLIGFLLLPIVLIAWLVLTIVAAIKAKDGVHYRYPFTIRLFT